MINSKSYFGFNISSEITIIGNSSISANTKRLK